MFKLRWGHRTEFKDRGGDTAQKDRTDVKDRGGHRTSAAGGWVAGWGAGWGGGWVALEEWKLRLTSAKVEVEVEVEAELGNKLNS